jgi:hypothetical protein
MFEVMTSTLPKGTLRSVASLLAATLYQGKPDRNHKLLNIDHGYVPLVVNTSRPFPHSRIITGFATRLTRQVPLVEQELLTLPEHLSSLPVLEGFVLLGSDDFNFTKRNPSFSSFLISSNPLSRKT